MNIWSNLLDHTKKGVPYTDYQEQLIDCLRIVDGYIHYAYYLQKNSIEESDTVPFHLKGTVILPSQMEEALQTQYYERHAFQVEESLQEELSGAWQYLESRIPETIDNTYNFLDQLFQYLYVEPYQRLSFLLGLAIRMDRKYERIIGFLQDNAAEKTPTLSVSYGLANIGEDVNVVDVLRFPQDTFLWGIVFDTLDKGLCTELMLRECVYLRMIGEHGAGHEFQGILEHTPCYPQDEREKASNIYEAVIAQYTDVYEKSLEGTDTAVGILAGKVGSGRRYIARQVGGRVTKDLLLIRMDYMNEHQEDEILHMFENAAATAVVNSCIPVLHYELFAANLVYHTKILEILRDYGIRYVMVITEEPILAKTIRGYMVFHQELGRLDMAQAEILWNYYVEEYGVAFHDSVDIIELSSKYKLTPEQIVDTLRILHTYYQGELVNEIHIGNTIRQQHVGEVLLHCKKIQPFFTMEDLILPIEIKKTIEYMIQRIKKESFVSRQWGFAQKYAYGKGIGILLYGRPGTGKSMCAHVLANALELDLLKVDLSSVMSKYIGETEKNLTEVFAEAEKTNTILFFDEADSLFSQRTKDMGGANDKYANLETAHLLQKLEEFNGICVLTTNMAMNFDKAFFRRFEFMINIPYPDEETRALLWNNAFPKECPRGEYLPLEMIAQNFELSPSEIKTIARNAAFQAVCQGSGQIEMEHIVEAIRMDYNKNGKVMPILPI